MRRFLVLAVVTLLMGAMLAASAIPVMASNGAAASGGAACNFGTETAHGSVPEAAQTQTAHENIPECDEE
jgi:hypothetical protein